VNPLCVNTKPEIEATKTRKDRAAFQETLDAEIFSLSKGFVADARPINVMICFSAPIPGSIPGHVVLCVPGIENL
jgi:hypothetical protein